MSVSLVAGSAGDVAFRTPLFEQLPVARVRLARIIRDGLLRKGAQLLVLGADDRVDVVGGGRRDRDRAPACRLLHGRPLRRYIIHGNINFNPIFLPLGSNNIRL